MRSPLHRQPTLRFAGIGKAVRMYLSLNIAITRIKIGKINPEAPAQSKQREMVSAKIHQTLKDSPQPH